LTVLARFLPVLARFWPVLPCFLRGPFRTDFAVRGLLFSASPPCRTAVFRGGAAVFALRACDLARAPTDFAVSGMLFLALAPCRTAIFRGGAAVSALRACDLARAPTGFAVRGILFLALAPCRTAIFRGGAAVFALRVSYLPRAPTDFAVRGLLFLALAPCRTAVFRGGAAVFALRSSDLPRAPTTRAACCFWASRQAEQPFFAATPLFSHFGSGTRHGRRPRARPAVFGLDARQNSCFSRRRRCFRSSGMGLGTCAGLARGLLVLGLAPCGTAVFRGGAAVFALRVWDLARAPASRAACCFWA